MNFIRCYLLTLATTPEHDADLGLSIAHCARHVCTNLWVINTFS